MILDWIRYFECSADGLKEKFEKYHQERLEHETLIRFTNSLKNEDVLDLFDGIPDKSVLYAIQQNLNEEAKSL